MPSLTHEGTFIELPVNLPVEVQFVLNEDEVERFRVLLGGKKSWAVLCSIPVEYGVLPKHLLGEQDPRTTRAKPTLNLPGRNRAIAVTFC